jgi:peptidoglycan/LPS O-acetylase OafA/YrhL
MKPPATRLPARLESVQVLRFFAALLVMGAHAKRVLTDAEIRPGWDASMLAVGVDVFFVISGFVIALSAERAASAGAFFRDRCLRVLPLYLAVSSLFVAKRLVSGETVPATEWVNSLLFVPLLDSGGYGGTFHPYGWSIAYEMWFYSLVALFLGLAVRSRAALLAAATLTGGSLVVALLYRANWLAPRFLFSPLVLEFAAGCALYVWRDRIRGFAWAAALALPLFGGGLCFTSYLGYPTEVIGNPFLGFSRALIWGGFAVCVFALFHAAEGRVRWPRVLVWLGTASYSLYLVQPFVVRAVAGLELPAPVRVAAFFTLSLLVGAAMYRWLEAPLLAWPKAWLARRRAAGARALPPAAEPARVVG